MKKYMLSLTLAAMSLFAVGCAITDYDGFGGHQTASEAKLWGQEISFIVGDPALDGTYAYTVKYNNITGAPVTILSYRNPVVSSFSRDGLIDRDGDDVQGRSGSQGGKFNTVFVSVDRIKGSCQFFTNVTQDKSGTGLGPLIALCATIAEEVDKDLELQASFTSLGDLINGIWSGALTGPFTAELTGVTLNGVDVPLANALSIGASTNGIRPIQLSVDLTSPGGRDLIQGILANTQNGIPVTVGLNFAGGMSLALPYQAQIAFNHDALWNLL